MRLRNIPAAAGVIAESEYCISDYTKHKGAWRDLFGNDHPLVMEIGMGKGKFLMEFARENRDVNCLGVERYESVLYRAVLKLRDEPLNNIRFLCVDAALLSDLFEEGEIDRIYLNFSDPWPKERHAKRRLTSRIFLDRYDHILKKGGCIEFKTDNRPLFDFTVEEAKEAGWHIDACTYDLHRDFKMNAGNIMTEYEEKFSSKGNPICKMILSRQK